MCEAGTRVGPTFSETCWLRTIAFAASSRDCSPDKRSLGASSALSRARSVASSNTMKDERIFTAAVVVIGNEILSGRTQDTNLRDIATTLGGWGIRVTDARVVPDIESVIVATVNE